MRTLQIREIIELTKRANKAGIKRIFFQYKQSPVILAEDITIMTGERFYHLHNPHNAGFEYGLILNIGDTTAYIIRDDVFLYKDGYTVDTVIKQIKCDLDEVDKQRASLDKYIKKQAEIPPHKFIKSRILIPNRLMYMAGYIVESVANKYNRTSYTHRINERYDGVVVDTIYKYEKKHYE